MHGPGVARRRVSEEPGGGPIHQYDPESGARWAGRAVYWVVMLATLMQVARVWNLNFVAVGFAAAIAYLPHAIAATAILIVTVLFGNWARDRIARSPALGATTEAAPS